MPRDLTHAPDLAQVGQKFPVLPSNFDAATLVAETEVTVWSKQIPQDKVGWFGAGVTNRDYAEAFIYAVLKASGNGSGAAGDAIQGELVAAITDSEQRRVLASTTIDALGELADAKASDRTMRPILAALGPYAKPGRHLEFRVVADPSSDGVEIDPSACEGRLYYSQSG